MANNPKLLEIYAKAHAEKAEKKALRLARRKPKWKDEKYMNKDQYEAYVDFYLTGKETDLEAMAIDEKKAKIAQAMYTQKSKEEMQAVELSQELDLSKVLKIGKSLTKSE